MTSTNLTADAIAAAVGYQNTSTLRALVRRRRGSTISALRLGRQADGLEDARLGPRRRSCARIFCCPVVRDGSLNLPQVSARSWFCWSCWWRAW